MTDPERATAQVQSDLQTAQPRIRLTFGASDTHRADVAKAQNLQTVLNGEMSVLWATPGWDLTSAVIERLNANPRVDFDAKAMS